MRYAVTGDVTVMPSTYLMFYLALGCSYTGKCFGKWEKLYFWNWVWACKGYAQLGEKVRECAKCRVKGLWSTCRKKVMTITQLATLVGTHLTEVPVPSFQTKLTKLSLIIIL